jgi:hypothetical protein
LLRSVYPVVLGVGGWFVGALIVLATLPTLPLDNHLLAVAAVGLPIGLAIYWVWVQRDGAFRSRTIGFCTAVAGALAGAWLGFNATPGLVAVLTTVVGAVLGANLALIVLDLTRDRPAPDCVAAAETAEALQARPLSA